MPIHATDTDGGPASDVDGMLTATDLMREPRLARTYVYVTYHGPTTVGELIEELDLARATAYDDIERLESMGVIARDETTRPHRLTGRAFAFDDGGNVLVTPTVLHAVTLTEGDDDAAYVQDRHGVGRLVAAVRAVGNYYAGRATQRMVADEVDLTPAEGAAIVYALRPAIAAGRRHDPYFDRLFPEIADEIDAESEDA